MNFMYEVVLNYQNQVQWLRNGVDLGLIAGDTSGRLQMSLTFDLQITGVQQSDQGLYTCRATNVNGEASNSTYLTVVGV